MRVLLIEDEDDHAELFGRHLRSYFREQVSLLRANDLDDGIAVARNESVDAVLLDLGLPGSSGLDTLHGFLESHDESPVVILTSHWDEPASLEAIRNGAQDYLCKQEARPETIGRALQRGIERFLFVKRLEAAKRSLGDFAATVSHDLRAPLRGIQNLLGFVLDDHGDTLHEEVKGRLTQSIDMARQLTEIISALLDFSALGDQVDGKAEWRIQDLLDDAIELLGSEIETTGARIHVDVGPLRVWGNRRLLVQVLQNLIGNSIKFSPSSPEVWIEVTQREALHVIQVMDHGHGIDPDQLESIFQPLARGRSEASGWGIGLASCARIVRGHGGEIWAESEPGLETRFYFTLPIPEPIPRTRNPVVSS